MLDEVRSIVVDVGLLPLVGCFLAMIDAPLLSAFIEQWRKKTSSFHISFGEMTIIRDYVSSLFHPHLVGNFFTGPLINWKIVCIEAETYLGVTPGLVLDELIANRGAHFGLCWL